MTEESCIKTDLSKLLQYDNANRRGHFFYFDSNKEAKLSKIKAIEYGSIVIIDNAEETLSILVNDGFKKEANTNGMTLVDCIISANKLIEEFKPKSTAIDSPERLATLLAQVGPNLTGEESLTHLRALIEGFGEDAALILNQLEIKNHRDKDGYILLRGKKEVK